MERLLIFLLLLQDINLVPKYVKDCCVTIITIEAESTKVQNGVRNGLCSTGTSVLLGETGPVVKLQ